MIAGNTDRIPFRRVLGTPGEHIRRDSKGSFRRIDVIAARDVFFQNIVLNGSSKISDRGALLFGDRDIEREKNTRRRIDRHRSRNFGEIDPLKEGSHIVESAEIETPTFPTSPLERT